MNSLGNIQVHLKIVILTFPHIKSKYLCPMTSLEEELIKEAMINGFFDKFDDELKDFTLLIDFLNSVETFKEDKINPLYEKRT